MKKNAKRSYNSFRIRNFLQDLCQKSKLRRKRQSEIKDQSGLTTIVVVFI